jgi:hypothetical protein
MQTKIALLIFLCSLCSLCGVQAQSLQGPTGLLNAPSADMLPEGTFFVGYHHYDKVNFKNFGQATSAGGFQEGNFQAVILDVTLFSFMEINFRSNQKDWVYSLDKSRHTQVDRNVSVKLRPIKEGKYLPAVAVGMIDVYGTGFEEMYYGVATKHFAFSGHQVGVTAGVAISPQRYYNRNMNGFFAGVDYRPAFLPQLDVMAEYDSHALNVGANLLLFNHLYAVAGLQSCKHFSGGISYRVYLKN